MIAVGPRRESRPTMTSPSRPEGLETLAHFGNEIPRLLPRREVPAFGKLVVVDELGIGLLGPALGGRVDLVREYAHGDRDLEAADVEEASLGHLPGIPVETSRRDRGVRQPVHRDVVEDVVSRETFLLSVEDALDERVALRVVIQDPRGQADGRVHETVDRLRAKPHLVGVAQALPVEEIQLVPCVSFFGRERGRRRLSREERLVDIGGEPRPAVCVEWGEIWRGLGGPHFPDGGSPPAPPRPPTPVTPPPPSPP